VYRQRSAGGRQLAPELPPRGCPVAPVGDLVGSAQGTGDRLANRVVDDEPVLPELDEGESSEAFEDILRRAIGQHRLEERERDSPDHRSGVERLPGRAVQAVEIEAGELVEDRLQRHVVELEVGAIPHSGSRELERERVPARQPVHAVGVGAVEAGSRQELAGLAVVEVAEPDASHDLAPARRCVPAHDGRLAPRQDEPRVVA
jgi:hypothetical protein